LLFYSAVAQRRLYQP